MPLGGKAQVVDDQRARPLGVIRKLFVLLCQGLGVEGHMLVRQVPLEFSNRQEQRLGLRRRAWLRLRLVGIHHHGAYPAIVVIELLLLVDNLFRRVRRGGFVQQLGLELRLGQEQRLRRANFGILHVAQALGQDLRQYITTPGRFYFGVLRNVGQGQRAVGLITPLVSLRLGEEVRPQVADATQCLGVLAAEVAVGRNVADRGGLEVAHGTIGRWLWQNTGYIRYRPNWPIFKFFE